MIAVIGRTLTALARNARGISHRLGSVERMIEPTAPVVDARRPRGAALIGGLAYVGGILDIIAGSMLLVLVTSAGLGPQRVVGGAVTAVVAIIAGIVVVVIASALLRGSRAARLAVTIARGATALVAILALVSPTVAAIPAGASILISAIVITWLWRVPANAFFSYRRAR